MHVRWYVSLAGSILQVIKYNCAGAALGSLGRHTQVKPDGLPNFDSRMVVLFKVDSVLGRFTRWC